MLYLLLQTFAGNHNGRQPHFYASSSLSLHSALGWRMLAACAVLSALPDFDTVLRQVLVLCSVEANSWVERCAVPRTVASSVNGRWGWKHSSSSSATANMHELPAMGQLPSRWQQLKLDTRHRQLPLKCLAAVCGTSFGFDFCQRCALHINCLSAEPGLKRVWVPPGEKLNNSNTKRRRKRKVKSEKWKMMRKGAMETIKMWQGTRRAPHAKSFRHIQSK